MGTLTWPSWLSRCFGRSPYQARHSRGAGLERERQYCESLLHDGLTNLANRFKFIERLDEAIGHSPAAGPRPALLVVDMDRLTEVNDHYGVAAGDEVLRATAARVSAVVSEGGAAFRMGGNQFAALLDPVTPDQAVAVAEGVLAAVREPIDAQGPVLEVSASVGAVMLGERHRADGVLRDADVAMYWAKAEGGGRIQLYHPELEPAPLAHQAELERLGNEVEKLRQENQLLTEALIIDPWTGLRNGAAFDADLLQLHARRRRSGEQYSVIVADLDHFHDYNERFGPAAGDEALRLVAQTISETIRQSDRAYRYGGEQFAVLLPGADVNSAVRAAERTRRRVERLKLEHPANPFGVLTVTIGVIEAGYRHPGTKDVLAELNDVLLNGKLAGRNRVVWPT